MVAEIKISIYITYDNEALQDGLGAQALRITGVYAVARGFGLKYIHSPILAAIEDVSHNLSKGSSNENLVNFFNMFFKFPSHEMPPAGSKVINVRSLSLRNLVKIYIQHRFSRKHVILKVLLPMPILDKLPSLYRIPSHVIRKINRAKLDNHSAPTLVAHIRRGYDEKYADRRYTQGRHLPFSYFTDALKVVIEKFQMNKGYPIVLHTDLVNKATNWKPKDKGVLEGFENNSGKLNIESIELEGVDLAKEIHAPEGFILDVHYCDALDATFLDMCTTKMLIQGRSALSYLAGIINPNVVIWPDIQTHAKLPRWYSSSDLGIFLRDELLG